MAIKNIKINVKTDTDYDQLYPVNGTTLATYNIVVPVNSFVADTTYVDYPFKAVIPVRGMSSDFVPHVNYKLEDALSGIYPPISLSGAGTVTIYASEIPVNNLAINSIIGIKEIVV
ncbi:MAG: hypothetical protein RSF40_11405 [Oscillospiraceae bacterium]